MSQFPSARHSRFGSLPHPVPAPPPPPPAGHPSLFFARRRCHAAQKPQTPKGKQGAGAAASPASGGGKKPTGILKTAQLEAQRLKAAAEYARLADASAAKEAAEKQDKQLAAIIAELMADPSKIPKTLALVQGDFLTHTFEDRMLHWAGLGRPFGRDGRDKFFLGGGPHSDELLGSSSEGLGGQTGRDGQAMGEGRIVCMFVRWQAGLYYMEEGRAGHWGGKGGSVNACLGSPAGHDEGGCAHPLQHLAVETHARVHVETIVGRLASLG